MSNATPPLRDAQDLPALPKPHGNVIAYTGTYATGGYCADVRMSSVVNSSDVFTADQMRAYACAAIAQPAPEAQPVVDKWEGAEEWMPLAWELCAEENGEEACTELVWEGGPVPEPWGDRWLKYEGEAKRLIALVRKCVPGAAPVAQKGGEPLAHPLPERDTKLTDRAQGVFRKFNVTRTDGSSEPGGKHHGCSYFVLDVDHDPCAAPALKAYADAAEATHPVLAADMRDRYGLATAHAQQPAAEPVPREKFDSLLAQEHALSDAYVRLRMILGAMNPPTVSDPQALWAYVEGVARERMKAHAQQPAATVQPLSDGAIALLDTFTSGATGQRRFARAIERACAAAWGLTLAGTATQAPTTDTGEQQR